MRLDVNALTPAERIKAINANQRQWIEALESGNYSQGQRYLRTPDGHCCLGVAYELFHGPACWESRVRYERSVGTAFYRPLDIGHVAASLHIEEQHALGLSWNQIRTVIRMNDDGDSFATIAKYLRKEFGMEDSAS